MGIVLLSREEHNDNENEILITAPEPNIQLQFSDEDFSDKQTNRANTSPDLNIQHQKLYDPSFVEKIQIRSTENSLQQKQSLPKSIMKHNAIKKPSIQKKKV